MRRMRSGLTQVATSAARRRRVERLLGNVFSYSLVVCLVTISSFVFLWTVLSSIKFDRDQLTYPPLLFFQPTLDNYAFVLTRTDFFAQLRNSLIIAAGAVSFSLILGLPAAYSIARLRRQSIAISLLIVRIVPGMVYMLPLFVLYKQLGLTDTHTGLIIAHQIITLPLIIWIMISFFRGVPSEIEEAATVDGATRLQSFWYVMLPLCVPGVVVATILGFVQSWNNFVFVLIIGGGNTMTLPLAVYNFMGFEQFSLGGLSAAAALLTFPILIISIVAQRWLVSGLTMGALK